MFPFSAGRQTSSSSRSFMPQPAAIADLSASRLCRRHARSGVSPEPPRNSVRKNLVRTPHSAYCFDVSLQAHHPPNCQGMPSPGQSCQGTKPSMPQIIRRAGHPMTALPQDGPLNPLHGGAFRASRKVLQPHYLADLIQQPWGGCGSHARFRVQRRSVPAQVASPKTSLKIKDQLTKNPANLKFSGQNGTMING